jgi:rhamnogalacturonan endolyase
MGEPLPSGMDPDQQPSSSAEPTQPDTSGTPPAEQTPPVDLSGETPMQPPSTPPGEPPVIVGDGFALVENLDRGVVAVVQTGGVYVGWRMFGYEYRRDNPSEVSYKLYRDGALIADVTNSTNFLDAQGNAQSRYEVAPVIAGVEGLRSLIAVPLAQNFLRIGLEQPTAAHTANDASVGDVDGDGQYEIFLKWEPGNARDNSQAGVTDPVFIDALKLDGTRLWRINLGINIRAGAHYTQFVVADADGDGRAEMAVKTAPGTRDGTGAFLSLGPAADDDDNADFRADDGYVLSGPEYLTVFDGATGRELATVDFDQARGAVNAWGDGYGNRVDRFLATSAYLDQTGVPSFVMARGYYTRTTLTAWNWRDGQLSRLWKFDSDQTPEDANGNPFTGQGAHSLSIANVDADPQQEIIYGAMSVDNDGRGLCSTNMNHGDALHVSDFVPERPGVEVFMVAESTNRPQWHLRDGQTCEFIRQSPATGADVGRGVAADIAPDSPGAEFWATSGNALRSAVTGDVIGGPQPNSVNFLAWWDADESRELENGTAISKLGSGQALLNCGQCASNNGTKSTPALVADLLGDWREEVIWRETNNTALRLYTTTDVTARRIYTLMHDPQYRVAISWQNVAYNQPPHPSFHIGAGMVEPPVPDIRILARQSTPR